MRPATIISSIMTRKPEIVSPVDTMEHVRKIFEKRGFHHVPVVDRGKLVGLVSYSDYLRLIQEIFDNNFEQRANEKVLNATLVKEVMTGEVFCLNENNTVDEAVQALMKNQFHSLPIVDDQLHLKGIVTTYDLMKVLEHVFAAESILSEKE